MGNKIPCGGHSPPSRRSSLVESGGDRGGLLSGSSPKTKAKDNNGKKATKKATAENHQNCTAAPTAEKKYSHPNITIDLASPPVLLDAGSSSASSTPPPPAHLTKQQLNDPSVWLRSDHIALRGLRLQRSPSASTPRALIALFPASDGSQGACQWACRKLMVEVDVVAKKEACLEAWKQKGAELIIVDGRGSKQTECQEIASSIRHCSKGQTVVLLCVVKKSLFEKDEVSTASLLVSGFNRVLPDSLVLSRGFWVNELASVIHHDVENALRIKAADAVFAALNGCRDIVQVTDSVHNRCVLSNSSCETILGFASGDLKDRDIWELQTVTKTGHHEDTVDKDKAKATYAIHQKLISGQSWEGLLNCRRKTGDYVVLETKIIPINLFSRSSADYFVYIKQPPPLLRDKSFTDAYDTIPPIPPPHPHSHPHHTANNTRSASLVHNKKSLKSFRNVSIDVGSVLNEASAGLNYRRQSGAKGLTSLTVEAPITKVINIISAAQENCPVYIAQELDKVLEILQSADSSNLFSPEVNQERKRHTDAVTTDLLGALLSNSTREVLLHQRRSSTEGPGGVPGVGSGSGLGKLVHSHRPSVPALDNSPAALRALLEKSDSWSQFDILELERLTEKRCLVWLGMTTLLRFDVHKTLRCSESTLQNWLTLIEANYKSTNSYHNSTHASDVLHAIACFLDADKVKGYCDEIDDAACLIAAAIHDVNHPGRNSAFLCNSTAELAILYNDITVLENHHASLGFKLTLSDERVNIFKNLDRDTYKLIRQSVVDMVLATDMSKHFVHVNKFNSLFGRTLLKDSDSTGSIPDSAGMTMRSSPSLEQTSDSNSDVNPDMVTLAESKLPANTPENVAILKRMMIKCADVSNPARPLHICKEWAYRIAEEYFSQTDDEKKLGLPVVMPQFDRTTCSIPKSQIGFYDFFIIDMFDMLEGFANLPELSDIIQTNYIYWKEEGEREEQMKEKPEELLEEKEEEEEENNQQNTT